MKGELVIDTIKVDGIITRIGKCNSEDLICVTDLARWENPARPDEVWRGYIRTRRNFEFVLKCEKRLNPEFKPGQLSGFELANNGKVAKPMDYLSKCNAKCVVTKRGNNGGVFVHRYIAYDFAAYINDDFRLYLLAEYDEYQRMKRYGQIYTINRESSKSSSVLLTSAIEEYLIPFDAIDEQAQAIFQHEYDIINKIIWGISASEWRKLNPHKKGNIRDDKDYTNPYRLSLLNHLQLIDNNLIKIGHDEPHRIVKMIEEANLLIKRRLNAQEERKVVENDETTPSSSYREAMLAKMGRNAREDGVCLDKDGIPRDNDGFVRLVPKGYNYAGTIRK